MKNIYRILPYVVVLILVQISLAYAQDSELNKSIATHRKGELTIKAKPGSQVSIEQLNHEFWFGCAIADGIFNGSASMEDQEQYKQKFIENFNSAVTENAVKWGNMERNKGEVNYGTIDAILTWTEENNIPIRGHNLFWGIPKFDQPWVKDLSDEELKNTIENRAKTIASRYKGRFVEYDLNNEMIHGNYYEDRLGKNITKKMVEWAQEGDPSIRLFVNDYDILTGNKLNEYMEHIRGLIDQDIPIAGIGVQGHLHAETFDRRELKNALDSLATFGLPIRITEFNIPGQRSKFYSNRDLKLSSKDAAQIANELVDYYKICFAHPAVEGIIMWGFWEGANWIPTSSFYKEDWTPSPSALAYQNLIFKEWWTTATGKTNQQGKYTVPAFFGKYKITVDGQSKEITLSKASGKIVVTM